MYFTKIRLSGLLSIDLPVVGTSPMDPYILVNADGLGPPEVDVSIKNTLNAGGFYQGRRPQSREIVLQVGLNPNFGVGQTASDLRASVYGMLTPGYEDHILVRIMDDDNVMAQTLGYVKKMEVVPFSSDPEIQITIACVDQYLQAASLLYVEPESKSDPIITNVGTAPAGFSMGLRFKESTQDWNLSHSTGAEMHLHYDFQVDDELQIDTRPGSRSIILTRNNLSSNIIWTLSPGSIWFMLHGGDNVFKTSSNAFDWLDVFYNPQYWGI